MRIYLAGRCDTDWRDELLGLKLSSLGLHARDLVAEPWPILKGVIGGNHDYVGAYPIKRKEMDSHGIPGTVRDHTALDERDDVFVHHNLVALDQCDVIFAWIDRHGLYGTIAEVAYAHGKGKTVWIAFKTPALELAYWFISHLGVVPGRSHHDAQAGQRRDAEDYSFTAVSAFDRFLHATGS